ncbi:MAG: helix-turn-helix domain-containing protein [Actinomycetota bacterium]|nr:helix-turn-helix domain-containing protein [Actinomycetota bacterium]
MDTVTSAGDDLDTYIDERSAREPGFRAQHAAALSRREMMRRMADARLAADRTQTELGAVVGTSQAQIARIEKGDADCRISSVERYAAALGFELRYQLVPAAGAQPPVEGRRPSA